jgi:hypothetical protein
VAVLSATAKALLDVCRGGIGVCSDRKVKDQYEPTTYGFLNSPAPVGGVVMKKVFLVLVLLHIFFCSHAIAQNVSVVSDAERLASIEFQEAQSRPDDVCIGSVPAGYCVSLELLAAAYNNDPSKQFSLYMAYNEGADTVFNLERSLFWLQRSANNGFPAAIEDWNLVLKQKATEKHMAQKKLMTSAAEGNIGLAQEALNQGADFNDFIEGTSALRVAAENGHTRFLIWALGITDDKSPQDITGFSDEHAPPANELLNKYPYIKKTKFYRYFSDEVEIKKLDSVAARLFLVSLVNHLYLNYLENCSGDYIDFVGKCVPYKIGQSGVPVWIGVPIAYIIAFLLLIIAPLSGVYLVSYLTYKYRAKISVVYKSMIFRGFFSLLVIWILALFLTNNFTFEDTLSYEYFEKDQFLILLITPITFIAVCWSCWCWFKNSQNYKNQKD